MAKTKELPNPDIMTTARLFKLGTRFMDVLGVTYKYAKLDFGVVGKDVETNKVYRHIEYQWIRIR